MAQTIIVAAQPGWTIIEGRVVYDKRVELREHPVIAWHMQPHLDQHGYVDHIEPYPICAEPIGHRRVVFRDPNGRMFVPEGQEFGHDLPEVIAYFQQHAPVAK